MIEISCILSAVYMHKFHTDRRSGPKQLSIVYINTSSGWESNLRPDCLSTKRDNIFSNIFISPYVVFR